MRKNNVVFIGVKNGIGRCRFLVLWVLPQSYIYSRKIHRTYTGVLKVSIILWEEEIAGGKVVHFQCFYGILICNPFVWPKAKGMKKEVLLCITFKKQNVWL